MRSGGAGRRIARATEYSYSSLSSWVVSMGIYRGGVQVVRSLDVCHIAPEGDQSRLRAMTENERTFDSAPGETQAPRTLHFRAIIANEKEKRCIIWIEDGARRISNEVAGVTVRDIEDFFKKHPALMLRTKPFDFSQWLVQDKDLSVLIADNLTAYGELGLEFDIKSSAGWMPSHQVK
jgi:hypothetical protein